MQALGRLILLTGLFLVGTDPLPAIPTPSPDPSPAPASGAQKFSEADNQFLDELQQAGVRYFWEAGDVRTGLIKDRSRADGPDERTVASIAATGFGLTALCIGDRRGFVPHQEARDRVLNALNFLAGPMPEEHGFFHHFIHIRTGQRVWNSEVSSIDSALLLCGVLSCRQYFRDRSIQAAAEKIYARMDWPWMLNGGSTFAHGWAPETGFLKSRWDSYSELMMIYLLALGSPTHPVAPETWDAWKRPPLDYGGLHFVSDEAPLFTHQYSHAWFDFRGKADRHANYFENSVLATRAHRLFCLELKSRFPQFSEDLWGVTASDSAHGYVAWGAPHAQARIDGTLVPCAAGGSLPFLPQETLHVLRTMRDRFGERAWTRYGFVDAFNPQTGWYGRDVIGIDVGIVLLMTENARSGFVWDTFMKNSEMTLAMGRAGFVSQNRSPMLAAARKLAPVLGLAAPLVSSSALASNTPPAVATSK